MKKIYFIDTENVAARWIPLFEQITKDDKILFFCTNKSPNLIMTYPMAVQIMSCKASVKYIHCNNGIPNALDFQLVTELGRQIEKNRRNTCQFVIVSGDKGFDAVVKYWVAQSVDVCRMSCAAPTISTKTETKVAVNMKQSPPEIRNQQVCQNYEQRLRNVPIEDKNIEVLLPILMSAMKKAQKERKQAVYMEICKKYGVTDGAVLYRRIRPLVMDIVSSGPFPA